MEAMLNLCMNEGARLSFIPLPYLLQCGGSICLEVLPHFCELRVVLQEPELLDALGRHVGVHVEEGLSIRGSYSVHVQELSAMEIYEHKSVADVGPHRTPVRDPAASESGWPEDEE